MTSESRGRWGALGRATCAVAFVGLLILATARWADLNPRVDRDFFFASNSGPLAQVSKIEEIFERHAQVLVVAASPDIASEAYLDRIEAVEEALVELPGVLSSQSLATGPSDLEDARESPLWRRVLLADDGSATHLLLVVRDPWPEELIPQMEATLARHTRADFSLTMGGVPYAVTVMQRQLVRDFAVFSAVAVAAFALGSLVLFRSLRVAIGVVASCTAAVCVTFLILQWAGASLGLLSANLVTIVFVLTQSHLVFLTSNWRQIADEDGAGARVIRAMRQTLGPSLGSMTTTLLGFGTLLFVDAKPLRELGLGGVVGGGAAFAIAFVLYPWFLAGPGAHPGREGEPSRLERFLRARHGRVAAGLGVALLVAGLGLLRLDTDPSLLAYFEEDGEIHGTLAYLDRHVGSTPFEMVLRRADGDEILDGDDAYESLWNAQRALESEPEVGRVLSLPVVLAEGERSPLSFLLPQGVMLRLLQSPLFDRVGDSFVSEDGRHTLFALQMVEHRRDTPRVDVVERLRAVAGKAGYEVPFVGGVYYLQGMLSDLVADSMIESLAALAFLFTGIAWLSSGSLRVGIAMTGVLALVPVGVFGGMGVFGIPVDVVTAPAASIGVGLGADALLHLVVATRRAARGRSGEAREIDANAWREGIGSQWKGIVRVSLIVALGFGLFAFSGFPPTRRFGLAVAASILITAPLALIVLPAVARVLGKRSAS